MLKIGVLGAGHLGKIHLRLLQQSEKYELVGFYDPNQEHAEKIAKEFGYAAVFWSTAFAFFISAYMIHSRFSKSQDVTEF